MARQKLKDNFTEMSASDLFTNFTFRSEKLQTIANMISNQRELSFQAIQHRNDTTMTTTNPTQHLGRKTKCEWNARCEIGRTKEKL